MEGEERRSSTRKKIEEERKRWSLL